MPATSKKQQKFMGLVRALQKGKVSPSKVSKKVKDVAKDMKPKDVKKYASTKHKGLPNKVKSEAKKMSDKDMYNYLMYMRKYKPDIWRDLQGNKKLQEVKSTRTDNGSNGLRKNHKSSTFRFERHKFENF